MGSTRCRLILARMVLMIAVALVASPAAAQGQSILVDFEGGLPADWFTFQGASTVTTTTQIVSDTDPLARPGQLGDNEILAAGFNITDFGGFGQDLAASTGAQEWINFESFNFWFYGTGSGLSYQAEIFDNRSDPSFDTAERFDFNFIDDSPGWRLVSIPFAEFTRATDFQPPGAPDDGLTLTEMWGWAIVLPQGADAVYFDDFGLGKRLIDDFESGLPSGTDGDGNAIGFFTFNDPSSAVAIATTDAPPAPVPGSFGVNNVLAIVTDVSGASGFAGVIHAFESEAVDTWTPQDWSGFSGLCFWLYGNNTGSILFIDILDNRAPGTAGDTAERFSADIVDDFSGWRFFEILFEDFTRKEIGNGAPNDGFTLTEVHGWAFGVFNSGQPFTNYLDDVGLFGVAEIPPLEVSFSSFSYGVDEGDSATVTVRLNRPISEDDDPDEVTVTYFTEDGTATADRDYQAASGSLAFVRGGASELSFSVPTIDDGKYEGNETVILRIAEPVGAPLGLIFQAWIDLADDDPIDRALIDDFEDDPYLWDSSGNVFLSSLELAAGDPMEVPGQGAFEGVLGVVVPLRVEIQRPRKLCNSGNGVVPVTLLSTPSFDATTVDHRTVTLGDAYETHVDVNTGELKRHEEDADGDGDVDLVFHFRYAETGLECDPTVAPFNGFTFDGQPITAGGSGARFGRDFALARDWTFAEGLRFWFYGQDTGDSVVFKLLDNRAPDPGPMGWELVWSDEFDDPAATPPDPGTWGHEIGDGTVNSIPGWGNSELQYYTDSTENAATDGQGNLVLTAREADGSLTCYYGPCEYTSARLLTRLRKEVAYGRIEARIKVPPGVGLWPAFWSLGTNIGEVGWPQAGEIDFMEFVGREPFEVFGTIHGPGYSGGASFAGTFTFGEPVSDNFHTFAVEWQPDEIRWFVDNMEYHSATPADVAPNEWVFNHPFYLLLNLAVGGNFGGPVAGDTVFPQSLLVDYVRLYQAPDTAERWEASFTDDFSGWQLVVLPFDGLVRSEEQPAGAPDDGLGLTEVWGYGFEMPDGSSTGMLFIDGVRLVRRAQVTVTNADDGGSGSLRWALANVADGGTVDFAPGLAGSTITLTSGPLVVTRDVIIDGSSAPGITVSGGGTDRVLIIDPGASANIGYLTIADGYGWQLAGGILNNGTLTLHQATVTSNTMDTNAGDFWQGGGGIYSGDGAVLNLIDSTVADNVAAWSGGGVYSFFNTMTSIVRSTISGNVSNDVGGGLRSLGNVEIINSTISGNEATAWYGGAMFITDGVVNLTHATVAGNVSPPWAPAAVFVGTFTSASATLNLSDSIVAGNVTEGCFLAPFGPGPVAINSLGYSVFTDGTCFPAATDQIVGDAGLDPLADNGGPTRTHALVAGSPAIDAVPSAVCTVGEDQRGVARPQGADCDSGAFEFVP